MRFLRRPPKLPDNPALERWLIDLADALTARDDEMDQRVPPSRTTDVNVTSRGSGVEVAVSHGLKKVPTSFFVIGTPDTTDDGTLYHLKQSRKGIGNEQFAYFKTDAPIGRVFRVRLEVR